MPERLNFRAREIMDKDVLVLPRDCPVAEAVRLMAERHTSCAVVVEEDKPIGIVSERDLLPLAVRLDEGPLGPVLRRILSDEAHIFQFLKDVRKADAEVVADVMSSPVECADADATLGQLAAMMETDGYRQLPVVREGRLIGLVTRRGILRALADRT